MYIHENYYEITFDLKTHFVVSIKDHLHCKGVNLVCKCRDYL